MKRCTKCGEVKPLSEFGKDKSGRDGISSWCKKCNCEHVLKWQSANREKVNQRNRKWRSSNRKKMSELVRKWVVTHSDRMNELSRKWSAANPEKRALLESARRARKNGNGGKVTAKEWQVLKEKYNYTCLQCGHREPKIKLTLDHVMPLKLGGRNDIGNAQPLCRSCNSRKSTRHIDYR